MSKRGRSKPEPVVATAKERLLGLLDSPEDNGNDIAYALGAAVRAHPELAQTLLPHFKDLLPDAADEDGDGAGGLHCVRCHLEFSEERNNRKACKRRHTEKPEQGRGGDYTFGCCGKRISRESLPVDKDRARETAEEDVFCYVESHTADYNEVEIDGDDERICCNVQHGREDCPCPICTAPPTPPPAPVCARCGALYDATTAPGCCQKKHTEQAAMSIFTGLIRFQCCGKQFDNPTKDPAVKEVRTRSFAR